MNKNKLFRYLIGIILALAAVRMLSLPWTPLTDTTEARYAEIGRVMADTGNYVTPMLDGAPFWAKPPLSFWATALSDKIFSTNDFAAHFPHFLFLLGAALLLYFFVRKWRGDLTAAVAVAAAMSMPAFLYLAGGVMTDPALAFCFTLCTVAFYNAATPTQESLTRYAHKPTLSRPASGAGKPGLVAPKRSGGGWGYLFFIGLALGLLAKGPLIFVLVGLPIFLWTLVKNKWRQIWKNVPWLTGTLLMLALAMPWYLMAEHATPGFLRYFIIGEHFERYITPHWAGDLYGGGRGGFVGKIWLFYILAAIPWSVWLTAKLIRKKKSGFRFFSDGLASYALWFAIAPLIFFTFSRNIVPAYVLPSLIPTGILIAVAMGNQINIKAFKWLAGINIALCVAVIGLQSAYPKWTADFGISDKYFISEYAKKAGEYKWSNLILYKVKNYSAEFYAAEHKIKYDFVDNAGELDEYKDIYARDKEDKVDVPAFVLLRKKDIGEIKSDYAIIASGKKMLLIRLKK